MYDDLARKRDEIRSAVSPVDARPNPPDPLSGTIFDAGAGEDPLAGTIFEIGAGRGASSSAPQAKTRPAQPALLDDVGNWDLGDPYNPWPQEEEPPAGGLAGFESWLRHLLEN